MSGDAQVDGVGFVVGSFLDGTSAHRIDRTAAVGSGSVGGGGAGGGGGTDHGPWHDDDPHRLAFVIVGNVPDRSGIWVAQYADRLARSVGPVVLLTSDGTIYSGQVFSAAGRAMPDNENGWLPHASLFTRRWLIVLREDASLEDVAMLRDVPIVLLTGADEAAAAAVRQKLRAIAAAYRLRGIAPRPISLVVCGAANQDALRLRRAVAAFAEDELSMHVEPSGSIQRIDLVDATGHVDLVRASRGGLLPLARRILEDRFFDEVVGSGEIRQSGVPRGSTKTSVPDAVLGESPTPAPHDDDPFAALFAPDMPLPSSPNPSDPNARRAGAEDAASAGAQRIRPAMAADGAGVRPSQGQPQQAPRSQPIAGGAVGSGSQRTGAFHEGQPQSLAALFDDLTLLAPRAPGALGVELAADLGGRLHLLSADATTLELRIARAWVEQNWYLLTQATRELSPGTSPALVEHLILDDATLAARLQGCGLRLHARVRVPNGAVRVDLNSDDSIRPR